MDVASYVPRQLKVISGLIGEGQVKEAQAKAVALSKLLQKAGGKAPKLSPAEILKLANHKTKPKAAGAPTQETTGGTQLDAGLIKLVDWGNFCTIYEIDAGEIDAIKLAARKALKRPDQARSDCKGILSRRNKKAKVKIKNDLYLAEAILHAMRMRADKQKLNKPMKLAEVPEEDVAV